MDYSKQDTILIAIALIIVIVVSTLIYFKDGFIERNVNDDLIHSIECPNYNKVLFVNTNNFTWEQHNQTYKAVNGFYRPGDLFCVSVLNRTLEQVSRTTFEEMAHHFNYVRNEHFKGDFR